MKRLQYSAIGTLSNNKNINFFQSKINKLIKILIKSQSLQITIILNNPLVSFNTPECKGNLENKYEERFALTDNKIYYKAENCMALVQQ